MSVLSPPQARYTQPGDRRDLGWSYAIEQLSDDLHKNPGGEGVFQRLKRLGFYDGPTETS